MLAFVSSKKALGFKRANYDGFHNSLIVSELWLLRVF